MLRRLWFLFSSFIVFSLFMSFLCFLIASVVFNFDSSHMYTCIVNYPLWLLFKRSYLSTNSREVVVCHYGLELLEDVLKTLPSSHMTACNPESVLPRVGGGSFRCSVPHSDAPWTSHDICKKCLSSGWLKDSRLTVHSRTVYTLFFGGGRQTQLIRYSNLLCFCRAIISSLCTCDYLCTADMPL